MPLAFSLILTSSASVFAQAPTVTSGPAPAPAPRPGPPIPPLRAAVLTAQTPGILRIVSQRGEISIDKGGKNDGSLEALQATTTLQAHDEIHTKQGNLELSSAAGLNLRIGEGSHVALLSPMALYLARGELFVTMKPGQPPVTLSVSTPCGRTPIKAREALVRVDGTSTIVSTYEGTTFLGGYPPTGAIVQSGQSNRCVKGEPMLPSRPLLSAPSWLTGSELVLVGDGGSPTEVTLRWQVVPTAQRYRVELYRHEGESEAWVGNSEASATRPQVELRELEVGSYVARVYAFDENGALGQVSAPHSFLLVRVGGLGLDGTIRTEAGVMPRVNTPPGMPTAVMLDGREATTGAPSPGPHQLRVMVAGLTADARLVASGQVQTTEPPKATHEENVEPVNEPPTTKETSETPEPPTVTPVAEAETAPPGPSPDDRPTLPPASPDAPPLEDVLLGGVGEVPFDGIRSPWAGSYIGARAETTFSGSLRVAVGGRYTMKNGFGIDASISVLRAAWRNKVATYNPLGFGNINAGVRTPALRRKHYALQGIVGLVAPVSTSFLDTSTEVDGGVAGPDDGISDFKADARPRGGGWRVEPALLFGVRARSITVSTMQGLSVRVAPNFGAAYVGGVVGQFEILSAMRLLSFAMWQVNYLGSASSVDGGVDAGGALGGGLEFLIPGGRMGKLRLALLARAGIGAGGAAIYGRGAGGLQLGYRFN